MFDREELNSAAPQQLLNILQQQVMVKDRRLVIVQPDPLLEGQIRMIPVVGVLLQNQAPLLSQSFSQRVRQRGFSAAAGPRRFR